MPEFPLIFKAPSLGDGFKSIGLVGIEYDLKIKNFSKEEDIQLLLKAKMRDQSFFSQMIV